MQAGKRQFAGGTGSGIYPANFFPPTNFNDRAPIILSNRATNPDISHLEKERED